VPSFLLNLHIFLDPSKVCEAGKQLFLLVVCLVELETGGSCSGSFPSLCLQTAAVLGAKGWFFLPQPYQLI